MNLSAISKKVLRYPVIFGCVIMVVVLTGIILWRGPMIDTLQSETELLERQWKQMQTNVERSNNIEEQLSQLKSGSDNLTTRLMRARDVAANHEFFYRIEAQTGVKIRNFVKGGVSDGDAMAAKLPKFQHFVSLPFNLGIEGEFEAVLDFLDQLKTSRHVVHVERVVLSLPDGAPDPLIISASLRCYILGEKES